MRILTAAEMRAVDQRAIEELGIPGMVLMENAASGAVDALAEVFPEADSAALFCGPGNNGGDGLAMARLLDARGYYLRVFLVLGSPRPERPKQPRGDAATQLHILQRAGIVVEELLPEDDLEPALNAAAQADVVVDALFGTGLSRPLAGHFATLVTGLRAVATSRLAVDLPSGLDGSRGELLGEHLPADCTVTFAAPKVAHIFPPAAAASGQLIVTDLGIPPELVEQAPGQMHLLTGTELRAYCYPRPADSHKGTFGHALIAGGAPGRSGAVVLAARAAVRSGAGLVTAAVPEALMPIVDAGSVESMTVALPASQGGWSSASGRTLLAECSGKKALALGPGAGNEAMAADALRHVALHAELPLVLDADGLNALAGDLGALADRANETVLTPHPGEMARLLGVTTEEVQQDRVAVAVQAAQQAEAVVVLKGHRTLVASPAGEVFVNPTGNAGMATGGAGDVLTGIVVALLAQGYDALAAAQLAVYIHGLAGDEAAAVHGQRSLAAGDLMDFLATAWLRLQGETQQGDTRQRDAQRGGST